MTTMVTEKEFIERCLKNLPEGTEFIVEGYRGMNYPVTVKVKGGEVMHYESAKYLLGITVSNPARFTAFDIFVKKIRALDVNNLIKEILEYSKAQKPVKVITNLGQEIEYRTAQGFRNALVKATERGDVTLTKNTNVNRTTATTSETPSKQAAMKLISEVDHYGIVGKIVTYKSTTNPLTVIFKGKERSFHNLQAVLTAVRRHNEKVVLVDVDKVLIEFAKTIKSIDIDNKISYMLIYKLSMPITVQLENGIRTTFTNSNALIDKLKHSYKNNTSFTGRVTPITHLYKMKKIIFKK